MNRAARYVGIVAVGILIAFVVSACGTEKIGVPKNDPDYVADTAAAKIFNERCGGCHTLSYAGTQGSGQNPRTYLDISGPNFDVRCERPVERVLYAIENGGFSGAYMPQNIVVGKQAREVAEFVARYAGRQAPSEPGVEPCTSKAIGKLPKATDTGTSSSSASGPSAPTTTIGTTTATTASASTAGASGSSSSSTSSDNS